MDLSYSDKHFRIQKSILIFFFIGLSLSLNLWLFHQGYFIYLSLIWFVICSERPLNCWKFFTYHHPNQPHKVWKSRDYWVPSAERKKAGANVVVSVVIKDIFENSNLYKSRDTWYLKKTMSNVLCVSRSEWGPKKINERCCSAHNQIYNSDLWNSELLNGPHSSRALPAQCLSLYIRNCPFT